MGKPPGATASDQPWGHIQHFDYPVSRRMAAPFPIATFRQLAEGQCAAPGALRQSSRRPLLAVIR
jgi:hypothetical protein